MTYRTRSLLNMVAAMALALLVGFMLHQWMQKARPAVQERAAGGQETKALEPAKITHKVAVAAMALPRGAKLSEQALKIGSVEAEVFPEGCVTNLSSLDGMVVAQPIAENEPVHRDKLVSGGIGSLVSPGKRAIAVQASKVFGLSGTIGPGSMADVLVTLADPEDNKKTVTKLVLANVPVLAADLDKEPAPKSGQKTSTNSTAIYTLELSPEESEKLAQATTHGTIHFALRNPGDGGEVATTGADYDRMISSHRLWERKSSAAKGRPGEAVETLRGTEKGKVNF